MDNKIDLKDLCMLKSYLQELLFDDFTDISIDENFICKIPNFTKVKIIIK